MCGPHTNTCCNGTERYIDIARLVSDMLPTSYYYFCECYAEETCLTAVPNLVAIIVLEENTMLLNAFHGFARGP